MDAIELKALRTLGERDEWPVNELPESIDIDLLRCLDAEGVIEARYVTAHNHAKFPGDAPNLTYSRSSWFSPIQNPGMAGPWEKWLRPQGYDCWNLPREVRVSDRGRAELARAARFADSRRPTDPAAEQVMARAAMFRASGASVYPGVLLVIRGGSFALHPVEDAHFDPDRDSIVGVAMWGIESREGTANEAPSEEGQVPLIAVDRDRPRTGLPVADAWIARADVARRILAGATGEPIGINPAVEAAATSQVISTVRAQAIGVIAALPLTTTSARSAIARVSDSDRPSVELLDAAIQALLAAVPLSPLTDQENGSVKEERDNSAASKENPVQQLRPLRDFHWTLLCEIAASLSPFEPAKRAGTSGFPKYHTLLRRLRELRIEGLVDRPLGERSGWCVTDKGRQRLKDNGFEV